MGHSVKLMGYGLGLGLAMLGIGCGSDGGADDEGAGGAAGAGGGSATVEYAVVVRGILAETDLSKAKAQHDAIAKAGEPSAKAAGDIAHHVLLGTNLLDSVENEFLGIDRWTDKDAMIAFYQNPDIQQAFGSLFAAPPKIEMFEYSPTWVGWGDMRSGEGYPTYYYHFALGTLAATDSEASHGAHDQVAAGGKEPALAAGNVAHVVFLGLDDKRRFLGVDVWKSADNMEAFYQNPAFVSAFAPLFESVSQPVYESTDWYQW